jgi:acetoacetyl-CoA reductase
MKDNAQVAVVTGAMGGIGSEICQFLRESGYIVVGLYNKSTKPPSSTCEESAHRYIQCDIVDHECCQNTIAQIINSYGTISILVNVAGITRDSAFKKMTYMQWNEVLQVNLVALYNITHPVFKHMVSNNYCRIVKANLGK